MVDFFDEPLAERDDKIVLAPGQAWTTELKVRAGQSRRYKAHLLATRNDGRVIEDYAFHEAKTWQAETRSYWLLRDLNWSVLLQGEERAEPAPRGKWEPVKIPAEGTTGMRGLIPLPGLNYNNLRVRNDRTSAYWAFIKADFQAPMRKNNERVFLEFPVAYHNPALFINARMVSSCAGAQPFDVDVTDALVRGRNQHLVLRLASGKAVFRDEGHGLNMRRVFVLPGPSSRSGLIDTPIMRMVPPIRIEKVFIDTSVRRWEIRLT